MATPGKYNFSTNPLLLSGLLLVSYFAAFRISGNGSTVEWIPALISFVDAESVTPRLSLLLSTFFLAVNALSLYIIGLKLLGTGKNKFLLPVIYLIFALVSPKVLIFSGSSAAALFVLWSLYFTISAKQGDLQFFVSGFLISVATLFEPQLTFIVPLIIIYSMMTNGAGARSAVLMLFAVAIPWIFMLSLRYLFFQDATLFAQLFADELTGISLFRFSLESVADFALMLFFVIISFSSVAFIMGQRNHYKILKSMAYTRFIILLLFLVLMLFIYPHTRGTLSSLIAMPVAVVVNEYMLNYTKSNKHQIQFIILLILILVAIVSNLL